MMNNKKSVWRNLVSFRNRNLFSEHGDFDIVKYDIKTQKAKNIRIIFISDTHFGKYPPQSEKISHEINRIKSDYIVFGGDIVSESSGLEDAFNFMRSLNAKIGKFSVLGNWELKHSRCKNISYWRAKYEEAGFILLHDKTIEMDNCSFTGFSPGKISTRRYFNTPSTTKNKINIFIAHSPDDIVSQNTFFDIAFSGHTHAGQIRLPLFGALKTSSKYWKKFEYGLYERNDSAKLIVSSGLGTSCLPIRFMCQPEIVLAEIIGQIS